MDLNYTMNMYSERWATKDTALKQEVNIAAEYTGLYGFIAKSGYQAVFPDQNQGRQVFYQGSRQMDNFSRRYYERELGAGIGPSPSMKEHFGYTEPFRRFVQRESFTPQANEIPNTMPSWMPGDDYMTNFRVGDPYVKVDQGFARLPGAGYEAIHQELTTRVLCPAGNKKPSRGCAREPAHSLFRSLWSAVRRPLFRSLLFGSKCSALCGPQSLLEV